MARAEADIRSDERARIAELILDDADTIAEFAVDPARAVRLVAHLIRHHAAGHAALVDDYSRKHPVAPGAGRSRSDLRK